MGFACIAYCVMIVVERTRFSPRQLSPDRKAEVMGMTEEA